MRAANLLRGIRSLFSGERLWASDLTEAIYTHGLVRGLYSDPKKDQRSTDIGLVRSAAINLVTATAKDAAAKQRKQADANAQTNAAADQAAKDLTAASRALLKARLASQAANTAADRILEAERAGAAEKQAGEVWDAALAALESAPNDAAIKAAANQAQTAYLTVAGTAREAQDAAWAPPQPLGLARVLNWFRGPLLRWIGMEPEVPIPGVPNQALLPAYIPSRTFALALIDFLNNDNKPASEAMGAISSLLAGSISATRAMSRWRR